MNKRTILKSSRHQKIIGELGEKMICNLLSCSGFEVTTVDHTGMDIIAFNPATEERMGISVKSRTRSEGKETTNVTIFRRGDREKMEAACRAFACEPWIGVYVETCEVADVYLTPLRHIDQLYSGKGVNLNWNMRPKHKELYANDPLVRHVRIEFNAERWFQQPPWLL